MFGLHSRREVELLRCSNYCLQSCARSECFSTTTAVVRGDKLSDGRTADSADCRRYSLGICADPLGAGQECAVWSGRSVARQCRLHFHTGWPTSPICSDMIFGRDRSGAGKFRSDLFPQCLFRDFSHSSHRKRLDDFQTFRQFELGDLLLQQEAVQLLKC